MFAKICLAALVGTVGADEVSIHKVDYPESGFCGEEVNVTKSELNPHYFFPMHFGGFHEGPCSDEGYTQYIRKEVVAMHPVPGVHHNLTFYLYSKPGRQHDGRAHHNLPWDHSLPKQEQEIYAIYYGTCYESKESSKEEMCKQGAGCWTQQDMITWGTGACPKDSEQIINWDTSSHLPCGKECAPESAMLEVQAPHNLPTLDVPTQEITLVDASRDGRKVSARVCVPEASGTKWPLYIFGHGFDCSPDDYAYFCKVAVTVLPFATNHTFVDWDTKNLAADAAFLSKEVPQLAAHDSSSSIYGKLSGLVVFGGHSMGGGTSVLAAAQPNSAAGMALFAPGLYTLPPAKPYLKDVKIPSLIVSGSDDCGPNQLPKQAQPAFDGLASEAKVLVSLKGANHCQWAAPTAGEIGVCSMPFFKECALIDADSQHNLGVELFAAFLTGLSGDQGWSSFEQTLAQGESSGKWTYFSSKTSPASKKLQNDCPCKKEVIV